MKYFANTTLEITPKGTCNRYLSISKLETDFPEARDIKMINELIQKLEIEQQDKKYVCTIYYDDIQAQLIISQSYLGRPTLTQAMFEVERLLGLSRENEELHFEMMKEIPDCSPLAKRKLDSQTNLLEILESEGRILWVAEGYSCR